jgi:hypothetical protein
MLMTSLFLLISFSPTPYKRNVCQYILSISLSSLISSTCHLILVGGLLLSFELTTVLHSLTIDVYGFWSAEKFLLISAGAKVQDDPDDDLLDGLD